MNDTQFISLSTFRAADVRNFPGGRSEITKHGPEVRIPDEFLKSVAFIGEMADNAYGDLLATGFFVSVPSRVGRRFLFFVTAKHIATYLKGKTAYISVNKKGGGITTLNQLGNKWWLHPNDPSADVALVECNTRPEHDVRAIPVERFITVDLLNQGNTIGVGDETFAIGLFAPAPGTAENLPIVRHGNISMIPREQLETALGLATVILVEARSLGGLSGSPAFVRETLVVPFQEESGETFFTALGKFHLLGLMHGHWEIKASDINKATILQESKHGVNLGVCIVVPAFKILETLNQEGLMKLREEAERKASKGNVPGMDLAKGKMTQQTFTRQDFEKALKKVSRRILPSQSDQEK